MQKHDSIGKDDWAVKRQDEMIKKRGGDRLAPRMTKASRVATEASSKNLLAEMGFDTTAKLDEGNRQYVSELFRAKFEEPTGHRTYAEMAKVISDTFTRKT